MKSGSELYETPYSANGRRQVQELKLICLLQATSPTTHPSTTNSNCFTAGKVSDIAEASDQLNISVLTSAVSKHFIIYPKTIPEF